MTYPWKDGVQQVLDLTEPLEFDRGNRLPIYSNPTQDPGTLDAAAQKFGEFLDRGMPISYQVPSKQGTVISGLVLRDEVLIRRTDFDGSTEPVEVRVGTQVVTVEAPPGPPAGLR